VLIYTLARAGSRTTPTTLILAGVALGAFLSAITWFLTFSGNSTSYTHQVIAWMMGSFALASWQDVAGMLPYLGIGWLVLFLNARVLNVLQLGDTQAQQLGVPVERVTMILIAAASLITAAAVATSGIIGFVGLIVPHAVRLIWGPDHRFLLPMSALVGATFLIIADTFARTLLAPTELPVGIITSFCGAPFFLYLLRQKKETLI
jgi:iron complex transport system permease protein